MSRRIGALAIGLAALGAAGCASGSGGSHEDTDDYYRTATSAAESACMAAVNREYGGRESGLRIVHSEFSEANSLVIVEANGDRWRCLSSNDGNVGELSRQ